MHSSPSRWLAIVWIAGFAALMPWVAHANPPRFRFLSTPTISPLAPGWPDPIAADFNNDGRLDLLDSGSVSLNVGFGDFTSAGASPYTDSYPPAVGDFDKDGKIDLAAPDGGSGIRWFKGLGNGTFMPGIAIPSIAPTRMVSGDFDTDGYADLALYRSNLFGNGQLQILLGQSGLLPGAVISMPIGDSYLATGDLDGDGKRDIFLPFFEMTHGLYWMQGLGAGAFANPQLLMPNAGQPLVGDLNSDGRSDLLLLLAPVQVYLSTGSNFTLAQSVSVPFGPIAVRLGDFNLDQRLDLLTTIGGGSIQVRLGNGNGTFGSAHTSATGVLTTAAPMHLDGDGNLDVVAGPYSLLGKGDGTFTLPPIAISATTGSSAAPPRSFDADGDGHFDIVMVAGLPNQLALHRGNGDGTFVAPVSSSSLPTTTSNHSNVADFTGDGFEDVITSNASGAAKIAVHRNLGGGAFTPAGIASLPPSALHLTAAPRPIDLDNDGDLDLAMVTLDGLYVSTNLGSGASFSLGQKLSSTSNGGAVATGDFDNDGLHDVATVIGPQSVGPVNAVFYAGTGSGGLASPQSTPLFQGSGAPVVADTHDVDHDGTDDLICLVGTRFTAAHLANALFVETFHTLGVGDNNVAARSLDIGDLDGDGLEDLVLAAPNARVYPGIPGNFSTTQAEALSNPGSIDGSSNGVALADFDENGSLDAAVARANPNSIGFEILLRDACASAAQSYGTGCPGSGGFVPVLTFTGCADPGQPVTLGMKKGKGGAPAIILLGASSANLPIGFGCSLLVFPVVPSPVTLTLAGGGNGNGSTSIATAYPPAAALVSFAMQAFVIDAGSPLGYAATNGIVVLH